jgi:UDP-N-acetylmuramoyl-tripeptide--D-alanyl-D-alanine ligase
MHKEPFLSVEFVGGFSGEGFGVEGFGGNKGEGFGGIIGTRLVGDYNLPNVLAAVAVGKLFHVPEEKIRTSIENYLPSNSRSQMLEKGNKKIILDAYNANPSSMKLAIENFAKMDASKKILVLGAMAELGKESLEEHAAIANEIKKYNWNEVILVGGDFEKIDHGFTGFSSPSAAGEWLKSKAEDATLLIKGSRSMQMEKVLDYL